MLNVHDRISWCILAHLKLLEKLGKVPFSRASSVKYKPLNYVFIRPVDKCQPRGNARVDASLA